ncbi:hypothetical protein QBC32DRAFT_108921 [Pseudoneurospora amorphoporcata]|uniref:CPAF-like PDZ domain-containing protein n=1 Tax=Pseudoneurospora amorphoporcata TaxID=241081 RepID=A0AAN6P4G8_9PEZI|nr:hypothetical protein QBC32DRAFT_108921 [Pseudoneurospora amorphoporcata]
MRGHFWAVPAVLTAVIDSAASKPVTTTTASPPVPTSEPCAIVSSSWASQKAANPAATPTVAAALAYECLNSIPLGKAAAIELVDSLRPYIDWQSDSAYKAKPPREYPYPGYDLFGALDNVKAKLQADKYANEYQFQQELYTTVFGPGHDGHFVFYPDALTRVFEWRRQRSLISISEDGKSLPVIKVYEDVLANPKTASVVKLINGIDAATYVAKTIDAAGFSQDPDANYNSMFYQKATFANSGSTGYFANGGRIRYIYQGANTTLTFINGTSVTLENKAAVKANMTGVTSGAAYYAKFCNPNGVSTTASSAEATEAAPAANVPGYPKPVIITSDAVVSGYFLEGAGYEDVAVIALLAFSSNSIAEFQAVVQDFIAEAVAAGKTKLIVDFQNNGGGYILQGYDFFRQLFPSIVQDGYSRWKETDSYNAMAQIVSDRVAGINPYTSPDGDLVEDYESWFNYRYDLNLTNQPFKSFDAKFAPHFYQNTKYTNLMRWDLNDNLTTTNDTYGMGIEITGYGSLNPSVVKQPFDADNIVILYDGVCASTCTLASEFLRVQAGVQSIAMGGRPNHDLIQGVGGVKGAQVLQYRNIYAYAKKYLALAKTEAQKKALSKFSLLPINRSSSAAVNVRDQILRDNVNDGTPAQFVVEESECRLFWTLDMVKDVSAVWRRAADVAFSKDKCNVGGIKAGKGQGPKPGHDGGRPGAGKGNGKGGRRLSEIVREEESKMGVSSFGLGKGGKKTQQQIEDWEAVYRLEVIP